MSPAQTVALTITLLVASNLFMTVAWYGHLKHLDTTPWYLAAVVSWGIALFEYLLQVPANRIGYAGGMSLAQLKILQEVITLAIFVPFASTPAGSIGWPSSLSRHAPTPSKFSSAIPIGSNRL